MKENNKHQKENRIQRVASVKRQLKGKERKRKYEEKENGYNWKERQVKGGTLICMQVCE